MLKQLEGSNWPAIVLLVLAVILYYVLPKPMEGYSDIVLFFAVIIHSSQLWGIIPTIFYVVTAMVIGYFAELIGINTGLIFGVYHYNSAIPDMIYDVPYFIPLLYVVLLYAIHLMCFAISDKMLLKKNLFALAGVTGFLATLKDTATDPLYSTVNQTWIWDNGGAYLGVPLHNFIGWFCVFFIITLVSVSLAWHRNKLNVNVHIDKAKLIFPILTLFVFILFAITAGLNVPNEFVTIGHVCIFIAILGFTPYFLLAWVNCFRK